ncbi:nitroreductase [Sphingomonas lutea]|uniref:Putative NAD(P)H nitroreductase n=1 Tax=Sphingomonas lutea TaxID=1045317 RepID=A0A7G9SG83_9SPHN|nr:nitroreductase [Sphingomonas lutea]QNN66858.1 nitroreductase [Sphingomonas lutea]
MLNDCTSARSLLETRRSGRPAEMTGPGPTPDELNAMLAIAARTPDHGKLCPWRFVTVSSLQRDAFADLLLRALAEANPHANDAHREKEAAFAYYPGQLVVLVSAPVPDHKIPLWEQELSCGAAGMNLLHAASALGFVGGWLTGWRAYSERVRAAFCAPGERIAGFIFIGHPARELEERPRPSLTQVVRSWQAPIA